MKTGIKHLSLYYHGDKYILCRLLMPPDEYASYREDETIEDKATLSLPPTVVQADKSKWSLYMHPKEETEVNCYKRRHEYSIMYIIIVWFRQMTKILTTHKNLKRRPKK